jgi:hypothetical protein
MIMALAAALRLVALYCWATGGCHSPAFALGVAAGRADVPASPATSDFTSDDVPTYLMPGPPYRMWSFAYNATAGGPTCVRDKRHEVNCSASQEPTVVPVDDLYRSHSYNLLNPGSCYPKSNTTEQSSTLLSRWLADRGVACMAWEHCWNQHFNPNTTNDSTVIASFRDVIVKSAQRGAVSIGLDECGDLSGPVWGHLPGDIPGERKMALAAEGFRQGKRLYPELFVAAHSTSRCLRRTRTTPES